MNPGKLDRSIQLQAKTVTKDAAGAPVETWATYATVWASKDEEGGREFKAFGTVEAETTAIFTLRYTSALTSEHRILCGTRIFKITAPPLEQGRRDFLKVQASEIKGAL